MEILLPYTVRDTPTTLIRKNTASGITGAEGVPPGRETIGRVAGGAVASQILRELGIELTAYAKAVGPVEVPEEEYRLKEIFQNKLYMPSNQRADEAASYWNL